MEVTVVAFGSLKDRFGGGKPVAVSVNPGTTVRQAVRDLVAGANPLDAGVAFALNRRIVRGDAALKEGDEIFLLPPVSGG